ncbi:MAG: lamin tail domain-containing protein [bacterium]
MKRKIFFLFLIVFMCFGGAKSVFAYDDATTHPALTDVIVDMYNLLYPGDAFTAAEKEWIIQGSTAEDEAPRWINHFYDPISGEGWTAEHAGDLDTVTMERLSKVVISFRDALPAKDWVHNEVAQKGYSRYGGNHTWESAIRSSANGDIQNAYTSLGYVLHIVEDMAVPDHTRNDSHGDTIATRGDASPYEEYAKKWTRETIRSNQGIATMLKNNVQPQQLLSLDAHIYTLADYSNKNFVSKDTISNEKYSLPDLSRVSCENEICFHISENGLKVPLFKKIIVRLDEWNIEDKFILENKNSYHLIFDSYFDRLSEQAVLHGVDVLRLFKQKTKEELENREYPQYIEVYDFSFLPAPLSSNDPIPLVAPAGEKEDFENKFPKTAGYIKSVYETLAATAGKVLSTTQETWQFITSSNETAQERLRSVIDVRQDVSDVQSNLAVISAGLDDKGQEMPLPSEQTVAPDVKQQQTTEQQPVIIQPSQKDTNVQYQNTDVSDVTGKDDSVISQPIESQKQVIPVPPPVNIPQQCSFDVIGKTFSWEVVINEVAWMGTQNSSSDEWIEIANVSGAPVDVSGWQLVDTKEQIHIVFPSAKILAPGDFLLLERTDDTTVPNVAADIIYTGALSNSNEGLRLFDSNCKMMDEALASPTWPAGSSSEKRTMERTGRGFYGIQQWHSSSVIGGTPRQANSEPYRPTSTGGGESNVTHYVVVSDTTETKTDTNSLSLSDTTSVPSVSSDIQVNDVIPDIHITEIMYDVVGSDEGKEWIEIYNAGSGSVFLDTLNLYENETNHRLVCENACSLPVGSYAVIVFDKDTFLAEYPDYSGVIARSSFSLSNSGEPLALVYKEGHIFDVTYSPNQGVKGNDLSLQEIGGVWVESVPTPGRENVFVEVTVGNENEQNRDSNDTLSEQKDESSDVTDTESTQDNQITESVGDDEENSHGLVDEQQEAESSIDLTIDTTVEETTIVGDNEDQHEVLEGDTLTDSHTEENDALQEDCVTDEICEESDISETDEIIEYTEEISPEEIEDDESSVVLQPVSGLSVVYNDMSRLLSIVWDVQEQEGVEYTFDCFRDDDLFDHTSFTQIKNSYGFYIDKEDTGALFTISLYVQDSLENTSGVTMASLFVPEFIVQESDHIVMSEILFDAEGSDEGKEFVELYNPTEHEIDVSGWTLIYRKEGQEKTLAFFGSKEEDSVIIFPKSFFLVGLNNYDQSFFGGKSADILRSASLPNGDDVTTIYLYDGQAALVDDIVYSSVSIHVEGESMERFAWSENEKASPLFDEEGEFLGNGYDNNEMDDFIARSPQPQNSTSLPEPRVFIGIDEWSITYNKSTLSLGFDFPEYSYEVEYELYDENDDIIYEGNDPNFSIRIFGVGRDYTFSLQMIDVDGFSSSVSSKTIHVPSFISQFAWYRTPAESKYVSESNALLEFSFETYPFLPQGLVYNRYPHGGPYNEPNNKLIAYYLNDEDIPEVVGDMPYTALNHDTLQIKYRNCYGDMSFRRALVLSDSDISGYHDSSCFYNEPLSDNLYFTEGDMHLTFPVSRYDGSDDFSAGDHITIAYYEMEYPPYEQLPVSFKLLATERGEYFFTEDVPIHEKPTAPSEVNFSFNKATAILTTRVSGSTDHDTEDAYIRYEISYDGMESWDEDKRLSNKFEQIMNLEQTYTIAIRAIDDFGLRSDTLFKEFVTPSVDPPLTISNIRWGRIDDTPTLSFSYTTYPFQNLIFGMMIAYLNSLPQFPPPQLLFDLAKSNGTNRLLLTPPQLCYGDTNLSYVSFSGGYEDKTMICDSRRWFPGFMYNVYLPPLDIHGGGNISLRIQGITGNETSLDSLTSDDYITLGFYTVDGWGNISIIGSDTHKYYFEP